MHRIWDFLCRKKSRRFSSAGLKWKPRWSYNENKPQSIYKSSTPTSEKPKNLFHVPFTHLRRARRAPQVFLCPNDWPAPERIFSSLSLQTCGRQFVMSCRPPFFCCLATDVILSTSHILHAVHKLEKRRGMLNELQSTA